MNNYRFNGYLIHADEHNIESYTTMTDTKVDDDEKYTNTDGNEVSNDSVKKHQIDKSLHIVNDRFNRLNASADKALSEGRSDNDYSMSGSSYHQAKTNGVRMKFNRLNGY